jgi:4-oxalocrotonate tautomerase family enzyme
MPLVTIKMIEGRDTELKRNLCRDVTDAIVKAVGCAPTAVHIDIIEYNKDNLAQAGTLFCDR